jgi:hypothetical protein
VIGRLDRILHGSELTLCSAVAMLGWYADQPLSLLPTYRTGKARQGSDAPDEPLWRRSTDPPSRLPSCFRLALTVLGHVPLGPASSPKKARPPREATQLMLFCGAEPEHSIMASAKPLSCSSSPYHFRGLLALWKHELPGELDLHPSSAPHPYSPI